MPLPVNPAPRDRDIVGLAYRQLEGAPLAQRALQALHKEGDIQIEDTVLLLRYGKGRPHVLFTCDPDTADAPAGAGEPAQNADVACLNGQFHQLAAKMPPNSSSLLVLVQHQWTSLLMRAIARNSQLVAGDRSILPIGNTADAVPSPALAANDEPEWQARANQ